jgi:hypothetical protein
MNSDSKRPKLEEIERGELTNASGGRVAYRVVRGWSLEASCECDATWKQDWLDLFRRIEIKVADESHRSEILASVSTEDLHWRWLEKALEAQSDGYEWFHLYADDRPQAACLIYHPERSELAPGSIFCVKFVAVAPWNRDCSIRRREFIGVGTLMIRAVLRFAVDHLKLRAGFCLHSLPRAEPYYQSLNLVKVNGKEDAQALAYYELGEAHATSLIGDG